MFADQTYNPPKSKTCPINKLMKVLNDNYKDSTRLKLKEKDIFEGAESLKSVKGEKNKKNKKKK